MSALPDSRHLFEPFDLTARRCVVAAVSGGGDSLALLLLLHEWSRGAGGPDILAVTIDHALRAESAAEAWDVEQLCRRLGLPHRTLRWTEPGTASALMASARAARYRLLAQAALEAGTDLVLTAHTLDDQAETVAMRAQRSINGGLGLGDAGIAPATLFDGRVWFARPLLDIRRAALRDHLRQQRVSWFEDPSNGAPRFERARVRAGLDEASIAQLADRARRGGAARTALAARAADLSDRLASSPMPGLIRLASGWFVEAEGNSEALLLVLRVLVSAVGGSSHVPGLESADQALRGLVGGASAVSLARCVLERRAGGLFIRRALRDLPYACRIAPGETWDGRFRLVGEVAAVVRTGRALGNDAQLPAAVSRRLARDVLASLPSMDGPGSFDACLGPWRLLLPSFDINLARSLARLLDAPVPALPPFTGHKSSAGFVPA